MLAGPAFASAQFKAGEVIVKYRNGATRLRTEQNILYSAAGVKSVKRYRGIMKGFEHLTLGANVDVREAVIALMKSPNVEYAQPNYILHAFPTTGIAARHPQDGDEPGMPGGIPCIPGFDIPGCDNNAPIPCLIPGLPFPPGCSDDGGGGGGGGEEPTPPPANRPPVADAPADVVPPVADTDLAKAYGLAKIGATEAWAEHRGDKKFIVADIDTGADYNHEDLSFNMWRNPQAKDGDVVGYDFVHNDGLPYDDNEHGTHTAGTIGAVGGNGKGVSGVAQRVSIMALKFLSGEGSGTTADAIRAIDYAIEHGAKVLSNSWGGKGDDGNQALFDAIERAKAKDVLFVAAAGNDGTNNDGNDPSYPAGFTNDNLISVAATDSNDRLASFSNFGPKTTHVAAPGVNVYSTIPGSKYTQLSGTSMACPHVAGAAALLWSKHPEWNYKKVKDVLMATVDKIAALNGKVASGGRINLLKALRSTE